MQKLTACLWFDHQAEEAAKFYTSIFKDSKITKTTTYSESSSKASGQKLGSVMTVLFQIEGQEFLALNGGRHFKLTPAISFIVNCKDQQELDTLWEKLSQGGTPNQCGWLTDKFGITWQIVPEILGELMSDPNKSERVVKELLQMTKLDIAKLQKAYQG